MRLLLLLLASLAQQPHCRFVCENLNAGDGSCTLLSAQLVCSSKASAEQMKAELPLTTDHQQLQFCFLLSSLCNRSLEILPPCVTCCDVFGSKSERPRPPLLLLLFLPFLFFCCCFFFFFYFSAPSSFHTVNHPPCRACDSLRAAAPL